MTLKCRSYHIAACLMEAAPHCGLVMSAGGPAEGREERLLYSVRHSHFVGLLLNLLYKLVPQPSKISQKESRMKFAFAPRSQSRQNMRFFLILMKK